MDGNATRITSLESSLTGRGVEGSCVSRTASARKPQLSVLFLNSHLRLPLAGITCGAFRVCFGIGPWRVKSRKAAGAEPAGCFCFVGCPCCWSMSLLPGLLAELAHALSIPGF